MVAVIIAGSGGVGVAAGWALARFWRRWAPLVLAAALILGAVALIIAGRRASGFDGLGYAIMAMAMVMPAAGGVVLGGLLGRRAPHRKGQTP